MSRLNLTAAGALFLSIGAFASAPSFAESKVGISASDAATSVCVTVNKYGPAQAVKTTEDGLGDWIVWVRDKDSDLWLCNASAEGNVYVNKLIHGDLLTGAGARSMALLPVSQTTSGSAPAQNAERLCAAAGRHVDASRIVATVADGVGDHVVWLQGGDHSYWLCNASADAKLFVFERVHSPLNTGAAGPDFRAT